MGAEFPRVTAVIVTYQSAHTIARAMTALGRSRDQRLLECVVVDNGSQDGTVDILRQDFPWALLIPTGTNNGFGRGCNIGLAQVATPYTVFVNPDAVVEPDAVRAMLGLFDERPSIGIVGPAIVEGEPGGPQSLQETGERMTPLGVLRNALPFARRRPLSRAIQPGSPGLPTGWVCGAVLMVRTEVMKRLGGFDPRFFLYWEETDVCKRAEDLGYEVWALGTAVAHHIGGASSSQTDNTRIGGCIAKHYFQSRFYYMIKHHGWPAAASAEFGEFVLRSLQALVAAVRGRSAGWLRSRMRARLFSLPDRV